MAKRIIHYSFRKAFDKLTLGDGKAVKSEIIEALGDVSVARFYQIRRDYPNIPAYIKQEIEQIFLKYGVLESEIWEIWE
jgi:hypothetical protein